MKKQKTITALANYYLTMDLEYFELALQHAGINWSDFIKEVERLDND